MKRTKGWVPGGHTRFHEYDRGGRAEKEFCWLQIGEIFTAPTL